VACLRSAFFQLGDEPRAPDLVERFLAKPTLSAFVTAFKRKLELILTAS